MATDATGAPTPLGIPKFNTSADAPSGLGSNAQMDSIDTLLAARVVKPAGIVSGEAAVWNGSSWDRSSVTRLGISSIASGSPTGSKFVRDDGTLAVPGTSVTYQTTLPGSPVDGQETILVDSTSAPNYSWRMRYNSTLAKWEYLGGRPKPIVGFPAAVLNTLTQVGATGYYRHTGTDFVVPYGGSWYIQALFGLDPNGAAAGAWALAQTFAGSAVSNTLSGASDILGSGAGAITSYSFLGYVTGVSASTTIGIAATSTQPGTHKVTAQAVAIYPDKII